MEIESLCTKLAAVREATRSAQARADRADTEARALALRATVDSASTTPSRPAREERREPRREQRREERRPDRGREGREEVRSRHAGGTDVLRPHGPEPAGEGDLRPDLPDGADIPDLLLAHRQAESSSCMCLQIAVLSDWYGELLHTDWQAEGVCFVAFVTLLCDDLPQYELLFVQGGSDKRKMLRAKYPPPATLAEAKRLVGILKLDNDTTI